VDIQLLLKIAPKLIPLLPRIEAAVATGKRIMADPAVKDAVAVLEEVTEIIEAAQGRQPLRPGTAS
jgi:hypothetical protein